MDININNNSKSLNENNNNFMVIDKVFPLTDTNKIDIQLNWIIIMN